VYFVALENYYCYSISVDTDFDFDADNDFVNNTHHAIQVHRLPTSSHMACYTDTAADSDFDCIVDDTVAVVVVVVVVDVLVAAAVVVVETFDTFQSLMHDVIYTPASTA